MRREFEIHCRHADLDIIAAIAFQAGKGACGLVLSSRKGYVHTAHGYGTHADAVRVYAALKANGIHITLTKGV